MLARRSPASPTRWSSRRARFATRSTGARGAVPRRRAADPDRGARGGRAARDCCSSATAAPSAARRLIEATEAAGGEAIETSAGHPPQDHRQGQSADGDRRLSRVRHRPGRASTASAAPIWIVAQALRDPGNLGTILRTGDAVGAGGLILIDDCVDPFSVEAVRARMGALFTQRIATARWDEFLAWLRAGPGQLVGTSLNTDRRLSAARATKRRPSSSSATRRRACPRPMRPSATCW